MQSSSATEASEVEGNLIVCTSGKLCGTVDRFKLITFPPWTLQELCSSDSTSSPVTFNNKKRILELDNCLRISEKERLSKELTPIVELASEELSILELSTSNNSLITSNCNSSEVG